MKQQLEQRLKELKAEFEAGQKMLAELESKQAELRNTLIRISGAVQVLQEELAKAADPAPADKFGEKEANGLARINGGGA
jgi:predicted nuclease with TOPRIM domain